MLLRRYASRTIGAIVAFVLLCLSATCPAAAIEYHYVAHKGNVGVSKALENTARAFQQAASTQGIWGIETDIWRTKDGRYVCVHSSGSSKASWCGMDVSTHTLKSLQNVKRKGGGQLASLDEYLLECRNGGKWAFIQIQDKRMNQKEAWAREVIRVVHDCGMLERCVFTSTYTLAPGIQKLKAASRKMYGFEVLGAIGTGSNSSKTGVDKGVKQALKYGIDSIGVYAKHGGKLSYARKKLNKVNAGKGTKMLLRANGEGVKNEKKARKLVDKYGLWCVYTSGFKPTVLTVTYKDEVTGKTIAKQKVAYGWDAAPPNDALIEHDGYTFAGWSVKGKSIRKNTTIIARYRAIA